MKAIHPKRILIPTDFSEIATSALHYGAEVARKFDAEIVALYADIFVPPVDYVQFPAYPEVDSLRDEAMLRLEHYLAENLPPDIVRRTSVVVTSPVDGIIRTAENEDIDLIVMGTHGRRGWRRALLGSVAEWVLRETDCPVITVGPTDPTVTPLPINRIVCPVNFTDIAKTALDHAVGFAETFGARLLVVNVIEPTAALKHVDEVERLQSWIPSEIRERVSFADLVLAGHPAERVIDFAQHAQANLIVLGAQHKRFLDTTVIGTTSERIARHAPCPVLTVAKKLPAEKIVERKGEEAAVV